MTLMAMKRDHEGVQDEEREQMKRWVEQWKVSGPMLEAVRRRDIREGNNVHVLQLFGDAFVHATRTQPARKSSGLVEMQRYFAKLRP